jgi:hypothetical protein
VGDQVESRHGSCTVGGTGVGESGAYTGLWYGCSVGVGKGRLCTVLGAGMVCAGG